MLSQKYNVRGLLLQWISRVILYVFSVFYSAEFQKGNYDILINRTLAVMWSLQLECREGTYEDANCWALSSTPSFLSYAPSQCKIRLYLLKVVGPPCFFYRLGKQAYKSLVKPSGIHSDVFDIKSLMLRILKSSVLHSQYVLVNETELNE